MLGQVSGENEQEPVEFIEIGDLSMRADDITVDYRDEAKVAQSSYRPPVRRFTTPPVSCNLGSFWVSVTIVRPKSKQVQGSLSLVDRKTDRIRQAITDLVETLEEELRC